MKLVRFVIMILTFASLARAESNYGNITASGSTCSTSGACVVLPLNQTTATVSISISGTYSATLAFEGSANGSAFVAILGYPIPSGTAVSSTTSTGVWVVQAASMQTIRVRASAYTSGSAYIYLNGSNASYARLFTEGNGLPGSPTSSIQYNSSSVFAGDANLEWDPTNGLTVGKPISAKAGTGTGTYRPSGIITADTTAYSSPGNANENTAWTYNLPANTLDANGKAIRVTAFGTYANNSDTKTVKLYFGTIVVDQKGGTTANGTWALQATIIRNASDFIYGGGWGTYNPSSAFVTNRGAQTLTSDVAIKITLQSTEGTAADLTYAGTLVEVL